jgi:hypothetical protein
LGFKFHRAFEGKTGMQSGAVIESFDVVEDGGACIGMSGEALMID